MTRMAAAERCGEGGGRNVRCWVDSESRVQPSMGTNLQQCVPLRLARPDVKIDNRRHSIKLTASWRASTYIIALWLLSDSGNYGVRVQGLSSESLGRSRSRKSISLFIKSPPLDAILTTFKSRLHLHVCFLSFWFTEILSPDLQLSLTSGLFPSGFQNTNLYAVLISPFRHTCAAHLILLHLITLKTVKSRNCVASHSAIFSNLSLPSLSQVQTFLSALCSQTQSVFIP
jgi:hypothetical protein